MHNNTERAYILQDVAQESAGQKGFLVSNNSKKWAIFNVREISM